MELLVDGFEAGFVDVGVALRRRDRGVTQEFLHRPQVGTPAEEEKPGGV